MNIKQIIIKNHQKLGGNPKYAVNPNKFNPKQHYFDMDNHHHKAITVVVKLSNCYKNSKFIANELRETLCPLIDNNMRPEVYGNGIQFIKINVYLSYKKCNYYITDDYTELLSDKQKEYPIFLRESPRFKYGNFMKKTGMAYIDVFLEKEFSDLSHNEQKAKLAEYFLIAIKTFAQKYQKKLNYPFDVMIADFELVLQKWLDI